MHSLKFRCWQDYRNEPKSGLGLGFMIFDINNENDLIMMANESPFMAIDQFTGLVDRNGIELYENDILQHYDSDVDRSEDGIVRWSYIPTNFKYKIDPEFEQNCGCCIDIYGWHLDADDIKKDIIIGNIHQNPEILNDNKQP